MRLIVLMILLVACASTNKDEFGKLNANASNVRFSHNIDEKLCVKVGSAKVRNFSAEPPYLESLSNNLKNEAAIFNGNVVTRIWKPARRTGWSFKRYATAELFKCAPKYLLDLPEKINPEWIEFKD